MLGLINTILTMLGKVNDNDHDKYHMYDSVPASILIFFRVVAVFTFFIGIIITVYYNRKDRKILSFYKICAGLGGIYFLSLPIIIVASKLFR